MPATDDLIVAWSAPPEERQGRPLVLALHGWGLDERFFAGPLDDAPGRRFLGDASDSGLPAVLPSEIVVASVRGLVPAGHGHAWYTEHGICRPVPESITATIARFFAWLDGRRADHDRVVVLGFSAGAVMACGLLMADPTRFAAAVLLGGTFPAGAGLPDGEGRLRGVPVFWGHDFETDDIIPADLVEATGAWLRGPSQAVLTERTYEGAGHSLSLAMLADVAGFLAEVIARGAHGQ